MSLPLSFLFGLLALFAAVELERPIPGSGSVDGALAFSPLLLLPTLLLVVARRKLYARLVLGRRGPVPPRALLRASILAVPAIVWLLFTAGGLGDVVSRVSGGSELLRVVMLLSPLVVMEVPRLATEAIVGQWCEVDEELQGRSLVKPALLPGLVDSWAYARLRLGWILLLVMPCLLFGAALDVLSISSSLQALVLITGFGSTAAMLLFMVVAAVILPAWFRLAFASRPLPEPLGERLRATAGALGFPPGRLFLLPTGQRSLNAMMVGPLPPTRSLGITDGLVQALGAEALAGVVAHEVGHAKRNHPALLVAIAVIVPLLLLGPLQLFDLHELPMVVQGALGVAVVLLGGTVIRGIAHRFEHEADVVSVQAFGAAPCSQALRTVMDLAMPRGRGWLTRFTSLHPDEQVRYEVMWRYERDPAFRQRFDRAGARLRATIGAMLLASMVAAAVVWTREWSFERPFVAFQCGDLVATKEHLDAVVEPVPARWTEAFRLLREDFAVAAALAPEARDWQTVEEHLVNEAWRTGVETLLREGPAAARPWLSIAVGVASDPATIRRTILDYCRAAAAGDAERMERAKLVVRRLGVPPELDRVF